MEKEGRMSPRKKRNLAIMCVVFVIVLPLYFISIRIEQNLAKKEAARGLRSPAVEDARIMDMRE
jgi:hypothetical protein